MEIANLNNELTGKTALVTGGTKGTGKAIAQRLANAGAKVIVTARNKPDDLPATMYFIAADLSTVAGGAAVIREINSTFGGVDILINNMGGSETPSGGFAVLTDSPSTPLSANQSKSALI